MINPIKRLLKKEYLKKTKSRMHLTETNPGQQSAEKVVMKITLTDLPLGGLIIKIPKNPFSSRIIDSTKPSLNYNKSCDYLILIPQDDYLDVYFIEMKKTLHADEKGVPDLACQQIISTIPMLDYLLSMIKTHFGATQKIEMHFTVIANRYLERKDKQGVRFSEFYPCDYKGRKFTIIHSRSEISFMQLQCHSIEE